MKRDICTMEEVRKRTASQPKLIDDATVPQLFRECCRECCRHRILTKGPARSDVVENLHIIGTADKNEQCQEKREVRRQAGVLRQSYDIDQSVRHTATATSANIQSMQRPHVSFAGALVVTKLCVHARREQQSVRRQVTTGLRQRWVCCGHSSTAHTHNTTSSKHSLGLCS